MSIINITAMIIMLAIGGVAVALCIVGIIVLLKIGKMIHHDEERRE